MDLLDRLRKKGRNTERACRAGARATQRREAPAVLLARLSASLKFSHGKSFDSITEAATAVHCARAAARARRLQKRNGAGQNRAGLPQMAPAHGLATRWQPTRIHDWRAG